jgi:phage terminase large subunit-like protein
MSRSIVRPLSCKWQGESLDYLWFDEEPPEDVYSEGLTRISATGGSVFMTFTPLLGMSEVVRRFLTEASADRSVTRMTIEDAGHISAAERARIVAGYPAHEREARAMGLPQLGSGRIFPLAARDVAIESFAIPRHWPVIGGLDWAWPADGLAHDKGSGVRLAELYRAQGLCLLPEHARFEDGSVGVEAGVLEMLERMQSGRWRVFHHLEDWFEEFRLYHRKDGRIVKTADDLLSASRYAMMMKRYAQADGAAGWGWALAYDTRWVV